MWPFPEPTGRPTLCVRLGLERSTFFFIEVQEVGAATALRDTSPLHPSACTITRAGGLDGDPHLYVSVQMAIAAARTGVSQRGASGCLMHVALAGYSGTGPTSCSWTIHRCASIARTAGMDWAPRRLPGRVLFPFHVGVQLIRSALQGV